ncbi:hypothetical protein [Streptomyces sp. Ag109_O5-1]|uniref:hypothetical protein n=1 Tax=Streptomyces sp. Ag109_O5-1 TaxID=1938851 RepID=UPI001625F53D|nr:hypothetical protein [Streptomyces sp. Ag109_O5-1]
MIPSHTPWSIGLAVSSWLSGRRGARRRMMPYGLVLKPLRPQEAGSAAGALNAVQQLGATLGVAVLGSTYPDGRRM